MNDEIDAFWRVARIKGRVADLEPFMGQFRIGTLPPPAFAFSDDAVEADEIADQVLEGTWREVTTPRVEFGEEAQLPQPADLGIVLDGAGHPRALIRTVAVEQVERDGRAAVRERFALVYPPRKQVRETSALR